MGSERIISFCKEHGYGYNIFGDNPQTVLIGERHDQQEQLAAQEELIHIIKPKVVLHELYDPTIFRKLPHAKTINESYSRYEAQTYKKWEEKYGFTLYAGDIKHREEYSLDDWVEEVLRSLEEWPEALSTTLYGLYYARYLAEPIMAQKILDKIEEGNFPILAVYGAFHLRHDSVIHKILRASFPEWTQMHGGLFPRNYITICQDKRMMEGGFFNGELT